MVGVDYNRLDVHNGQVHLLSFHSERYLPRGLLDGAALVLAAVDEGPLALR